MVYFYMIILTYTPNERDIIQNAPNPLFRVFNENTQKKEYIFSKSTYFCPSKQCQSDNMINLIILTPKSYVDPT